MCLTKTTLLLAVVALSSLLYGQAPEPNPHTPKAGYVPDAATAVSIAEAVLIPVYGKAQVASERPFKAHLKEDIWIVTGTLHCEGPKDALCKGGTAEVRISKRSAAILFMIHYK